jgi:hypothetical protein
MKQVEREPSVPKRILFWLLLLITTVVLGRYIDQNIFRLLPGPDLNAGLKVFTRDPASSCDVYAFHVIFNGDYKINKVHLSIQTPQDIVEHRLAYAVLSNDTTDYVGPMVKLIRKVGGCGYTTPQEPLSPNLQEAFPYPNEMVIDATDVQNPIVGEIMTIRPVNLVESDFHTSGFYDYEILGLSYRRKFRLKVDMVPVPLPK